MVYGIEKASSFSSRILVFHYLPILEGFSAAFRHYYAYYYIIITENE